MPLITDSYRFVAFGFLSDTILLNLFSDDPLRRLLKMEIRHLISFLQVAMLKSFTKAGDSLGYSQANVSLQIRQLESELGVPLFDRIGKTAHLTQYGEMLVPYAQNIVSTTTTIDNMFREKENLAGNLRVGFVESLFECLFKDTLSIFHREFPRVTVEVIADSTTTLLKLLHSGQLDIVCMVNDDLRDQDLLYWDSIECDIVIVSNNDHPLTSRLKLDPGDLDGQEFIMMEDSAPYVLTFNHWLRDEEIEIVPCIKVQIPFGAKQLLYNNNYLSVLPEFSVKKDILEGRITKLNVEGFAQTQHVQFLTHKSKVLTPQIEGFLSNAVDAFRDLTENN